MTFATESIPQSNEPRIPQAVAWLVVLAVLLALGGGGWFAWKQWFAGPTESGELDVGTIPDRFRPFNAGGGGPRRPDLTVDGIHAIGGSMFRIQSGSFFMTLAPTETSYAPLRLMNNVRQMVSADELRLIRLCNESANNAGFAKTIDMTPEQAKQLVPIRQQINAGMKIEDADRTRLRDLWKNWNAAKDPAAKAPAEAALLAAMKEIGNKSMDATKQQYAALTAEIRKIVTDQQIAKYRQQRG